MTKVLIDCDPGIDDALALALAAGASLDVRAITTVAGNVGLNRTTANALALRDFLDLPDVPVVAGSPGALVRGLIHAEHVHGSDGLGGAVLPPPTSTVTPGHATDHIITTLRDHPGEITLIALGPLTNLALALRREPRIADWAAGIVVMGGSYTRGNHNPAAEFNILTDPEAAAIVFGAGWTVTQIGLDVTLTARVTTAIYDRLQGLGRLSSLLLPSVTHYGLITPETGPAIHDAVAVASVIDPTLLTFTPAVVNVETAGVYTTGMTVIDFKVDDRRPNAMVATRLDVERFWDLLVSAYRELGRRIG
ncbi:nucleoside hydrolase [Nonomuraea typhae]|uniref:nucleoside hydrolase n=1 Tax=Nonomuraea typhae TaxID=2603600 RepID=UPI0012F91649|nr:nucleoside hydrolase [Nonomuraea typhae]